MSTTSSGCQPPSADHLSHYAWGVEASKSTSQAPWAAWKAVQHLVWEVFRDLESEAAQVSIPSEHVSMHLEGCSAWQRSEPEI